MSVNGNTKDWNDNEYTAPSDSCVNRPAPLRHRPSELGRCVPFVQESDDGNGMLAQDNLGLYERTRPAAYLTAESALASPS